MIKTSGNRQVTSNAPASAGFLLPTILVLSITLLTLGLSLFQLGTATVRTLRDQNWNRMAHVTAEAGVAYAQSCLENASDPTSAWSSDLKPDTDCTGSATAASAYVRDETSTGADRYRTSFAVQPVATGSDNIPKAKTVGTVEVLAASSGTVTKTYTSETTVILNVSGGGGGDTDVNNNGALPYGYTPNGVCRIKNDKQVWCQGKDFGDGKSDTEFGLPAGLTVKKVAYIVNALGITSQLCVIASNDFVYCSIETNFTATNKSPLGKNLAGGPVQAASLWNGYESFIGGDYYYTDNNTLCVVGVSGDMYCWSHTGAANGGNPQNIGIGGGSVPSGTGGFFKPVKGFTAGTYFSSGTLKIKQNIRLDNSQYNPGSTNGDIAVSSRCALATDDQVYCTGVCIIGLFGTALYGSGQKGCDASVTCGGYFNPPCATSTVYNPAPSSGQTYNFPVKYILPAGVTVKSVSLQGGNPASGDGTSGGPEVGTLCVNASNAQVYCTGYTLNYDDNFSGGASGAKLSSEPKPMY